MKKLALLMCAVMLLGVFFACIPASAASTAKTAGGPLAITEMCPAPEDSKYEYIEIVNISSANVDIKDYFLYRVGFSNGSPGNWHAMGTQSMIGTAYLEQNDKRTVRISCENATGDTTLEPNVVTVVWLVSGNAKDETIDDFKLYWQGSGHDLTNTKIVRLQVCDDSAINLAPATIIKGGYSDGTNSTFLPEADAGFMIMLIHKDVAAEDVVAENETNIMAFVKNVATEGETVGSSLWRSRRADCAALMIIDGKCDTTSAHYYNIVDVAKYNTARGFIAMDAPDEIANKQYITSSQLPYGMMTPERVKDSEENLVWITNRGNSDALAFFDYAPKYLATPGTLYRGQLGNTDGETPALYAANGAGTLVEGIGSTVKNLAIIEGDNSNASNNAPAPEEDTTAAPADTTPVDEGGCGSVVATSAIAVMAPVMALGLGLTLNKKKRK